MESTKSLQELVTGHLYQIDGFGWACDMRYPRLTKEDFQSVVLAPTEKVDGILSRLRDATVEAAESIRGPVAVPWHGIQQGVFEKDQEKFARVFVVGGLLVLLMTLVWGMATSFGVLGYLAIALAMFFILLFIPHLPSPWNSEAYQRVEREQREKEWFRECIARSGLPVVWDFHTLHLNEWQWRIEGEDVHVEFIRLQVLRGDEDLKNFVYDLECILNHYYGRIRRGKEYCYMDRTAMRAQ